MGKRCLTFQAQRASAKNQPSPEGLGPAWRSSAGGAAPHSSFASLGAKRADLRCAIRVPRSYRPATSTIITGPSWEHQPPLFVIPGFQEWSAEPQIRSLRSPDFLLRLVALANFMRLSSRERRTRNRVQRSVQEIRIGMTRKGQWFTKEWLLNRGIFQIEFGQLLLPKAWFSSSYRKRRRLSTDGTK